MKIKVKNYSTKKCADSIFGQIEHKQCGWGWISLNKKRQKLLQAQSSTGMVFKDYKKTRHNPIIILILESPHCAEHANAKPCAANGRSGKNIFSHLCDVFNNPNTSSGAKFINNSPTLTSFLNNNIDKTIDVWVVNSVQYQCSLGITPICHIIKESNWIDEWHSSRNDFIQRITDMADTRDVVVINLCTQGVFVPMKEIVKNSLSGFNNNYCDGPHPSSWGRLKHVEIKQK